MKIKCECTQEVFFEKVRKREEIKISRIICDFFHRKNHWKDPRHNYEQIFGAPEHQKAWALPFSLRQHLPAFRFFV
jgi:hypothetical protein